MDTIKEFFGEGLTPSEFEPIVYHRTELETFINCPMQGMLCAKNRYESHNGLADVGEEVHLIADTGIRSCNMDLQEASDYINNELPKSRPDLQPDVLRAGRTLANRLRWSKAQTVIASEEQLTRLLLPETQERGEILITTEPDLVLATDKPDTIIVIDYKSGWKEYSNSDALDCFQTCVICWVIRARFPEVRFVEFRYWNTRRYTTGWAVIDMDRNFGTEAEPITQEEVFEARINEGVRIAMGDEFPALPSSKKCMWCDALMDCRLPDTAAKTLKEDVKGYVDTTIVLEEQLAERMKHIKEATKDGRTLYGTSGYYNDEPKKKSARRLSFKEKKDD